jgi:hypothetical protein
MINTISIDYFLIVNTNSMARKSTRKGSKAMSIPALRQSFEHMESMAVSLATNVAAKKMTKGAATSAYAKEWKRVFHRDLPSKSASAAIDYSLTVRPLRRGKRTMRGGMAPVGWTTVPQQTAPALPGQITASGYVAPPNVLPYVSSGFDAVTWKDSLSTGCGSGVNPYPAPYADIGSNAVVPAGAAGANSVAAMAGSMKGGRRRMRTRKQRGGSAFLAAAFRPVLSENPSTFLGDLQTSWRGQPPAASPSPTDPAFTYRYSDPSAAVSASALDMSAINRIGTQDVSSVRIPVKV